MRTISTLCAVAALAVAGCGGTEDDETKAGGVGAGTSSTAADEAAPTSNGSGEAGATQTSTASNEATATSPHQVTIRMKNIQFDPKETTIKVGQTVKWINEDSVPHNVVADSGASFKSPTFSKDGTYTRDFTKAGEVKYECTLHPGMEGTLRVQ